MFANKKLLISLFIASAIFLFFSGEEIFAASISTPSGIPSEVQIGQSFNVGGNLIDVQSGQIYFVKCRVGQSQSSLGEGQTYNSSNDVWLSDGGAWVDMPTVVVSDSPMGFSIQCRVKPGVIVGQKWIYLRGCLKESDGTCKQNFQSLNGVNFSVLEAPTPTPSSTPTPTSTPISTPTSISPTSTPTGVPTPTPISYSNIYLSEFLPDPESGNEKVEIKNANSFSVSLVNWQIDDIENGGHSPKTFSAEISPSGLFTIDLGNAGFLNNGSDSVRLLDFNGAEKDKKDYSSSTKNLSWTKDRNGNWCEQASSFNSQNSDCPSSTDAPTATLVPTSTPASTSAIKPSLTPTKTPTPSISLTATPSGEVLGEFFSSKSGSLTSEPSPVVHKNNSVKQNFFLYFFIGLGIIFIGGSVFLFFKNKRLGNL